MLVVVSAGGVWFHSPGQARQPAERMTGRNAECRQTQFEEHHARPTAEKLATFWRPQPAKTSSTPANRRGTDPVGGRPATSVYSFGNDDVFWICSKNSALLLVSFIFDSNNSRACWLSSACNTRRSFQTI